MKTSIDINVARGDIFEFAKNKCDAAILWLKPGFNGMFGNWLLEFLPGLKEHQIETYNSGGWETCNVLIDRAWKSESSALLRITPAVGRLKYLYIHPNPEGLRVKDISAVKEMTEAAMKAIVELPVVACCMNGIQSGKQDIDVQYAKVMFQAVSEWFSTNKRQSLKEVFLVDLRGGFDNAAQA